MINYFRKINNIIFLFLTVSVLFVGCSQSTGSYSSKQKDDAISKDIEAEMDDTNGTDSASKASELFWGLNEETDNKSKKSKKSSIIIEHIAPGELDSSVKDINSDDDIEDDWTEHLKIKDEKSIEERRKINSTKRVVCWGDSMTIGYGGTNTSYPKTLETESGAEVLNYGVFGETTRDIAARAGAISLYSSSEGDLIIPADTSPIILNVSEADGTRPKINMFGNEGINPCTLAGVKGTFYHDDLTGLTLFKRNSAGAAVTVPDKTPFITYASTDYRDDDILILWTGNNEMPETVDAIKETIRLQKMIISHTGVSKYAVVSLTSANMLKQIDLINEMFKEEYGSHFIDLRSYVLTDMLDDAGIDPTEKDMDNIRKGYVPLSLLSDEDHGNDTFYEYAGKYIYKSLQEMGYLE